MRKSFLSAIGLLVASSYAGPAAGAVIVTYQSFAFDAAYPGNRIIDNPLPAGSYDTTMRITATLLLDAPLPLNGFVTVVPLSFTVSDGRSTITEANATSALFSFQMFTGTVGGQEYEGLVADWVLDVTAPGARIVSRFDGDTGVIYACDPPCADMDSVELTGGDWNVFPVPEPSTGALMGLGVFALAGRRRMDRSRSHRCASPVIRDPSTPGGARPASR